MYIERSIDTLLLEWKNSSVLQVINDGMTNTLAIRLSVFL